MRRVAIRKNPGMTGVALVKETVLKLVRRTIEQINGVQPSPEMLSQDIKIGPSRAVDGFAL